MIRTFGCRDTEKVFRRLFSRRFHAISQVVKRRMDQLQAAHALSDLAANPGARLEKLSGDRKGRFSIRINEQWRIVFLWHEGEAWDVKIVDYH